MEPPATQYVPQHISELGRAKDIRRRFKRKILCRKGALAVGRHIMYALLDLQY
jgi:hypothetical protein